MRDRIIKNGRTATLTKARKQHDCNICILPIIPPEDYWLITINGAGVTSFVHPERVHVGDCIAKYWEETNE